MRAHVSFVLFTLPSVPLAFAIEAVAIVFFCAMIWPTVARVGSQRVSLGMGLGYV